MEEHKAPHRVRAARRGAGFTQSQFAQLTGYRWDVDVSRAERGTRPPSLRFLIGSTIIFGRSVDDLFKALFDQIEECVVREAYVLHEQLAGEKTPTAIKCCSVLSNVISRAAKRHKPESSL